MEYSRRKQSEEVNKLLFSLRGSPLTWSLALEIFENCNSYVYKLDVENWQVVIRGKGEGVAELRGDNCWRGVNLVKVIPQFCKPHPYCAR